ncbi:MAG: Gfo/Idh/MocA family oxidoreductase [Candidatus Pseudobacter hemicellulosilyticus]|uniref:Gfo/Idh/MocA family oxidoreductase n=1 Tax=Candidatus Pseudobacter hemicellulosilyticus TaxID=3121375 RepID=A0AAJ6BH37_9BACT|nr:MAG: Gfo/Idh/MocA family oxidoreductase [Pseudobacter sp.]
MPTKYFRWLLASLFLCAVHTALAADKLKVVVAGLNHDHVHLILRQFKEGKVIILGIAEPSKELHQKFAKQYQLPDSLFYTDLKKLLAIKKPDAVLGYNEVGRHLDVVQLCAPLGIPVMVEKPLAATLQQARQIEAMAKKYKIPVLTNYETTWYASVHELYKIVQQDSIGLIRKMVVHDGHEGPKEIGCSQAFLDWLTDPVLNGAGALNDFGCYGANIMTWLMQGKRPIAVTAVTRQYKPAVYPKVDDDATIIVEYAEATGLIEASWNWPYSIKDLEIFGRTGYLHALDGSRLQTQLRGKPANRWNAPALIAPADDCVNYLAAFLRKELPATADLSSLENNMIVMEILDAAKRSAQTGKRIVLE